MTQLTKDVLITMLESQLLIAKAKKSAFRFLKNEMDEVVLEYEIAEIERQLKELQ